VVSITFDSGIEFDLSAIPDTIRESGFTPGEMYVRARGTVEGTGANRQFRIRGWRQTYPVSSPPPRQNEVNLHAKVEYSGDSIHLVPKNSD
jgi:hypothetical protein